MLSVVAQPVSRAISQMLRQSGVDAGRWLA